MFDLRPTEEQDQARRMAAEFAARRLAPGARRVEQRGVGADLSAAYDDLGFGGIEVPEDLGGSGLGPLDKVMVLEALARGDVAATLALDGPGPALYPLIEMGGAKGRELLRELCDQGARAWVIVDAEPSCISAKGGRLRARFSWIPARALDLVVVLSGSCAYVVKGGMQLSPVGACALHGAGASELGLDAAPVAAFEDARGAARTMARLRLYAAALMVGVASASFEHAKSYTKERVAFGRPIAHHQAVAFMLAELATRLEAARMALWRGAWSLDQTGDPSEAAAAAWLEAHEIGLELGEQAVQLLGGHGYMKDHPVEKWMREQLALGQLWGGRDGALDALASALPRAHADVGFALGAWPESGGTPAPGVAS